MIHLHFVAEEETEEAIEAFAKREHRSKASVLRLLVQIGLSVAQEFPNLTTAVDTTADNQILHNLLSFPQENDKVH